MYILKLRYYVQLRFIMYFPVFVQWLCFMYKYMGVLKDRDGCLERGLFIEETRNLTVGLESELPSHQPELPVLRSIFSLLTPEVQITVSKSSTRNFRFPNRNFRLDPVPNPSLSARNFRSTGTSGPVNRNFRYDPVPNPTPSTRNFWSLGISESLNRNFRLTRT